ncbi:putative secondary metabolism biosynthetic enzyme [Podospora pseudocomata]|uniref:Secondary metabolism biosynthetic enzyme n=1 Tax=Podospora pseudocomata TaxID=2093779 RepID=A0ABR0GCI0_9PEZI|nr:putative secondary metabolism biosynthetic enzyme [Podospora pseudocomata]
MGCKSSIHCLTNTAFRCRRHPPTLQVLCLCTGHTSHLMATSSPRTTNVWEVVDFVGTHHDTYAAISPADADLSGKSVLITGASRGIGMATGIRFAVAGCSKIALAARSSLRQAEQEIKAAAVAAGREEPLVLTLNMDVTVEESVTEAVDKVSKAFGGSLDVLIANAGYLPEWRPVVESDPTEWWKTWEINIKGTYLCAKSFIPLLLESSIKTFITVSSAGAHALFYGASAYQTTKFATLRFTEFIDQEYHDKGLIAVAIHPGAVKTELALNMPEEHHTILQDTPELPADAMVWLAKERREWLAGRFFNCCWDVDELENRKDEITSRDLLKFRLTI